ncbi:hypothetical protein BDY19DRAFT_927637 [Irpex rosettiformis]|uniref:Uncharacterized protein n=1 Tax=Irpex rosettiformis TaxID=378272 RepID=A0ACB8UCJ1_9APHY|nr:hypothetical protein BDY19DRAFT_927637 [Irpex rosettiformis]
MPQVSPTRTHPRMSPTSASSSSPSRPHRRSVFMPSTRPKHKPVAEMTIQELQDRHAYNSRRLREPTPSTSTYVQRISAEQAAIEDRLVELGVDNIQKLLNKTNLDPPHDQMHIDQPQAPELRPIGAKQRALAKFSARTHEGTDGNVFTFQEAMQIEQEAHRLAQERKQQQEQKQEEKRRRMGLSAPGEKPLSRIEQEARIYAFMSYKPTDSDLEDEDEDEDSDDDDPAGWFDDDQDDGRKGQDIIEPDEEDLSNIIRIDESRIPQNNFFEREGE